MVVRFPDAADHGAATLGRISNRDPLKTLTFIEIHHPGATKYHSFLFWEKVCENTLNNDKDLIQLQAFCQLYIMFFATFPI